MEQFFRHLKLKFNFSGFHSVFIQLFLSFIMIMIPFQITGFIMFTWGQNTIRKEIEASASAEIHFLCSNFEYEMQNISNQLERLINDSNLKQFSVNSSNLTDAEFYISLMEQNSLISTVSNNHPIIKDIVIYYNGFNKALSASQNYITSTKDAFNNLKTAIRNSAHPLKEVDSNLFLGMMYPTNSIFNYTEPRYIISMYLSRSYISNYLSTFEDSYDTVMFNHSTMTVINSSKKTKLSLSDEEYMKYYNLINNSFYSGETKTLSIKNQKLYVFAEYSSYLNCSFIQFVPISEIMRLPRQYNWYLVLFSFACITGLILYTIVAHRLVKHPVNMLLGAFHKIESGDFEVQLNIKHPATEFKHLINGFNKMAKRLDHTIDQLYMQKIYTQRMELKQLQMQINPHFLYNSYFILHRLVMQEDVENAKQLSKYLGKYFEYITRNGLDKVPLKREWEHAVNYLEIQAIRYSIRLSVRISELPKEFEEFIVPKLILQPILENAIEHGLDTKLGDGIVTLSFIDDDSQIILQVTDNGDKLQEGDINALNEKLNNTDNSNIETTALINIHRRLRLEYGKSSGISLLPASPSGLCVKIWIDKME